MAQLSECDLQETNSLIEMITTVIRNVSAQLSKFIEKADNNELQTEKGLSLLELKNHGQLSYLANLTYLILRKLNGLSIEGNSSVNTLVEIRVLLERIRPLEDKAKYQIEKYLKAPTTNDTIQDDLNLKGNLDNIESSSEDDNEEDHNSPSKESKGMKGESKLYKISKITQTHYPGDEEKPNSRKEREKKRILHSSMLQDALSEHMEDPEVVTQTSNVLKQKALEKRRMITRYEEDNFTRLTLSKKDKQAMRAVTTPGSLTGELLSFRDLGGMEDGGGTGAGSKKRKKGSFGKGVKGKKGFKKRKK